MLYLLFKKKKQKKRKTLWYANIKFEFYIVKLGQNDC